MPARQKKKKDVEQRSLGRKYVSYRKKRVSSSI